MTNTLTDDRFSMTYRDFYIDVNGGYYVGTCYSPRIILRDTTIDGLRRKIDDYVSKSY